MFDKTVELRGANKAFFASREHECLDSGPADTGKTFSGVLKLHVACSTIPKTQVLVCRKTFHSLSGTIVKTIFNITNGQLVRPYGGENPSRFIYPNGSTIWLGGLDNSGAFLSGYFDYCYINQTEEISLDDWEMLGSRCTGRNAVVAYPQMLGDPNPSSRQHWILERAKQGKLRLLKATHKDNPELYDTAGNMTEEGKIRIGRLAENLTGVRRQRLFEGVWATAEGVVFDTFSPDVHVVDRPDSDFPIWYLCQDEGYTNPAVILLVGCDADGRWHVAREFYKRGVAEIDVVKVAAEWFREKQCEVDAVDAAGAGLIAALINEGVNAVGGKGRILDGILGLQNRMKVVAGDVSPRFPNGRPRLTFAPTCVQTINEFESHLWKEGKDIPLDCDNHSIASLRYLHDVLVVGTGSFNALSVIHLPDAPAAGGRSFQPRSWPGRR